MLDPHPKIAVMIPLANPARESQIRSLVLISIRGSKYCFVDSLETVNFNVKISFWIYPIVSNLLMKKTAQPKGIHKLIKSKSFISDGISRSRISNP